MKKQLLSIIAIFLFSHSLYTQEKSNLNQNIRILSSSNFPVLTSIKYTAPNGDEKIKSANALFSQYQKDIEKQAKLKRIPNAKRSAKDFPTADFYVYKVPENPEKYLSDFISVSARLQISQGTLATVNSISSPQLEKGKKLVLPVNQGLFIAENPKSSLEILLKNEYSSQIDENETPKIIIDGRAFYFLEDKNFSPTDIAFFHDDSMQLPLDKKVLTSPFGYRTSPISGKWTFHAGIDLAAPVGTEVHATKTGVVLETGTSEVYGNFIRIQHNGKKTSLYAHLSKILVQKNQKVSTGETIGLVGTTGMSTGPHLHFEVREDGKATNPAEILKS